MKKSLFLLISVACSLLFTATLHAAPVGKLTFVLGKVSIKSTDQVVRAARQGDPIQVGDTIRSKIAAKAVISFDDGDIVRMAPKTKITIESYIPHDPVARIKIHLANGKIQSSVKKPVKVAQSLNRYVVETPTTIIGVRGTVFFTTHIMGVTTSLFTSGQGYGYNKNFPDKVMVINPGQVVEVGGADDQPVVRAATSQEIQQHTNDTSPDGGLGDDPGGGGGGDNTPPTTYVPPATPSDPPPSITSFQDGVVGLTITGMELDINSQTNEGVMGVTGVLDPSLTQIGNVNAVRDNDSQLVGTLAGAVGSWTGVVAFLHVTPVGEVSYLTGNMFSPVYPPVGPMSASGPVELSDPLGMVDVTNEVPPDPFPDSTLAMLTNVPVLGSMDFGDWVGPGVSVSAYDLNTLTLDDPAGTIAGVWSVVTEGGEFSNQSGTDVWEIPYGFWDTEPGEENFKWAQLAITDDLAGHTSIYGSFESLSADYYGTGEMWGAGSYAPLDDAIEYHSSLAGTHTLTPLAFGGTAVGNFYPQMGSGAFLPPWRAELLNDRFPLSDPFAIHGALGGLATLWQENAPFMILGTFVEPDGSIVELGGSMLSRVDVDGTTEDGGVFRVNTINLDTPDLDFEDEGTGDFDNIGTGLYVRSNPEQQGMVDDPENPGQSIPDPDYQPNVAGLLLVEPFVGFADSSIGMWRAEGFMTPVDMPVVGLAGGLESLEVEVNHAAATLNQHVQIFVGIGWGWDSPTLVVAPPEVPDSEGPLFGTLTSTFENIPGQSWGTWTALTGGTFDDTLLGDWTVTGATTPGLGLGDIDFSEVNIPVATIEEQIAINTLPWGSTPAVYQDLLHQENIAGFVESNGLPQMPDFSGYDYQGLPSLFDVASFFAEFDVVDYFDIPGEPGAITMPNFPGYDAFPSFEEFLGNNFLEQDYSDFDPQGLLTLGEFLVENYSDSQEVLAAELVFLDTMTEYDQAIDAYEDFVFDFNNLVTLHGIQQVSVDGNTVILGNMSGQLPGRYGISIMLPALEGGQPVNLQYNLNTEDYPYFDSFSVSLSEVPFWSVEDDLVGELVDPLDDSEGLDVGFLWYGLGDYGALENLTGNQELLLPEDYDAEFVFLNIFLDTFTQPDSDEELPSWGSFTINEPDNSQVVTLRGATLEGNRIEGTADGAWVSWTEATTNVMAGQLAGTFDPEEMVWQAGIAGAWIETATFLDMVQNDLATLNKLNIPAFQVGSAVLAGGASGDGWELDLLNMTTEFFAYSDGGAAALWASGDVAGSFSVTSGDTSVLLNQPVYIATADETLSATFAMTHLNTPDALGVQNGTWGGSITNGNGIISVGPGGQQGVIFSGFAAGPAEVVNNVDGVDGTFGGTGAGTVVSEELIR